MNGCGKGMAAVSVAIIMSTSSALGGEPAPVSVCHALQEAVKGKVDMRPSKLPSNVRWFLLTNPKFFEAIVTEEADGDLMKKVKEIIDEKQTLETWRDAALEASNKQAKKAGLNEEALEGHGRRSSRIYAEFKKRMAWWEKRENNLFQEVVDIGVRCLSPKGDDLPGIPPPPGGWSYDTRQEELDGWTEEKR